MFVGPTTNQRQFTGQLSEILPSSSNGTTLVYENMTELVPNTNAANGNGGVVMANNTFTYVDDPSNPSTQIKDDDQEDENSNRSSQNNDREGKGTGQSHDVNDRSDRDGFEDSNRRLNDVQEEENGEDGVRMTISQEPSSNEQATRILL